MKIIPCWYTGTGCKVWNWLEIYCNWMAPIFKTDEMFPEMRIQVRDSGLSRDSSCYFDTCDLLETSLVIVCKDLPLQVWLVEKTLSSLFFYECVVNLQWISQLFLCNTSLVRFFFAHCDFRWKFLGRLLRVHLITLEGIWNVHQWVCMSVCTHCTSIRLSVHKKFFRFHWNMMCK